MPRPTPTRLARRVINEGTAIATVAKMTKTMVTSRRAAWWRVPPGDRSMSHPIAATAPMRRIWMMTWELMGGGLLT